MGNKILLKIESPELFYTGGQKIKVSPGLTINEGITFLIGRNGSGKSTFAKILANGRNYKTNCITTPRLSFPKIKMMEFTDIHSLTGLSIGYYQQRYESGMNEEVSSIEEILGKKCENENFEELCKEFNLIGCRSKKINCLSSGELRKFLILNVLTEDPDLLILDNPYIGLDHSSKETLNIALKRIKEKGRSVILLVSDKHDLPSFYDNIIYTKDQLITDTSLEEDPFICYKPFGFIKSSEDDCCNEIDNIIEMENCNVKYSGNVILENVNWVVKKGEKWIVTGENGSGKSTMLSLINADHPQGYSNELKLFGRRRGTGESIWDIKSKIGYVSPEMILNFNGNWKVIDVISKGLTDRLYNHLTDEQIEMGDKWLAHLGISNLRERKFRTLSSGEKQLVLIARSMIKQPELLILDEPMHALDQRNLKIVKSTIKEFLDSSPISTLIMVTHNEEEFPEFEKVKKYEVKNRKKFL